MKSTAKKHSSGCPVAYGLDIFGDRWTLLILRDMILHGKHRYGELLDAEEGIATNILADRLKQLEADGIVTRARDPENRRSYIYTLTEKGLSLMPVLFEIIKWSGRHSSMNSARKRLIERLRTNPEDMMAEIRAREALRNL